MARLQKKKYLACWGEDACRMVLRSPGGAHKEPTRASQLLATKGNEREIFNRVHRSPINFTHS